MPEFAYVCAVVPALVHIVPLNTQFETTEVAPSPKSIIYAGFVGRPELNHVEKLTVRGFMPDIGDAVNVVEVAYPTELVDVEVIWRTPDSAVACMVRELLFTQYPQQASPEYSFATTRYMPSGNPVITPASAKSGDVAVGTVQLYVPLVCAEEIIPFSLFPAVTDTPVL